MANALYDKGREHFLDGAISWSTHIITGYLADAGVYTRNLATDASYSDITTPVATSGSFANKTITNGVADADDIVFAAVTGAQCEYVVIFDSSNGWLIACIDTATGLPITPNGTDITVVWDNGANKIFKL